jgi:hypothetical protein
MIAAIPCDTTVEFVSGQLVGQLREDGSALMHEKSPYVLSREKSSELWMKIEIENGPNIKTT